MPKPNRTTKLKAAPGTTDVTVGTQTLPIASDGTVDVPDEAVDSLTGPGGFTLADVEVAPPPEGHVEVDHADANASLSFGGASFARGEDGRFFVPLAAAAEVLAHGFRIVPLEEIAAKAAAALEALTGEDDAETSASDDAAPSEPAADPVAPSSPSETSAPEPAAPAAPAAPAPEPAAA